MAVTVRQLINALEANHSVNRSHRSVRKSRSSHTRLLDHIVSSNAAVVTCRSRRRNKEERKIRETLLGILGNRWSLQGGRGGRSRPCCTGQISSNDEPGGSGRTDGDENQERRERTKNMVSEFGATLGCRGCLVIGQPHAEECRARIAARMEHDLVHAKRLEDKLNRRNELANAETTVAVPRRAQRMRRKVRVKTDWTRHKNPRTLEELQAVQLELMWTCE